MNIDPWSYVTEFEKALGEYTGAPYVITTDCATHAMELCLRYLNPIHPVQVPKHTYLSVPMMVEKIGAKIAFMDAPWEKFYQLHPYPVIDGSVHFEENCYVPGTFYCLSFQHKKRLNLGRGGAILTDNKEAYELLKKMRYDGRTMPAPWPTDSVAIMGYHYYMTPEEAQRGLLLLKAGEMKPYKKISSADYPDLTYFPIFRKYNTEDIFHNGYHKFLYAWEPRKAKLQEIFVGQDGTTSIENTYDIITDVPNARKAPYLCSMLHSIYRINPKIFNHFTEDLYLFSVNNNDYLNHANIQDVYPNLKKVKIFEIEVQWGKMYPSDAEDSDRAIRDWFIENNNSLTTYKNFNNVNQFAKNNNIDTTYYTCETGLDFLNKDYLESLEYKIESFNFFLLSQTVEYTEFLKDKKYPYELTQGKDNPYFAFLNKENTRDKILNLNRRPDWHRHLIAQSILGQFENNRNRILVTWMSDQIKAYHQHPITNGKSEYFNLESTLLPMLSKEERDIFDAGERILEGSRLIFDKDERQESFTMRYADALENYTNVGLEVVSESIFFGPFGDVSEKSLRPLILGIPCIIAGGPNSFKILEKLGFKSYDHLTGYKDSERNNLIRLRSLIEFTDRLAKMSNEGYASCMEQFYINSKDIIEHNQQNFQTGQVIENYIKWIKEIHQ